MEELGKKINLDRLPHGFVSHFTEEAAAFSLIRVPGDNSQFRPELAACLVVQRSLSIFAWKNGVKVPPEELSHLLPNDEPSAVDSVSQEWIH